MKSIFQWTRPGWF